MNRYTTKEILFESLNELVRTKPLSKITVDEITSNCNYKRGTFYYYFKDKEDMIHTMIYHTIRENHRIYFGIGTWGDVLTHNLEFSNSCRPLIQQANLNYQWFYGDLLTYTEQYVESIVVRYLKKNNEKLTSQISSAISFYAGGAIRLYQKWIFDENPISPKETALLISSCVPPCIREALNAKH